MSGGQEPTIGARAAFPASMRVPSGLGDYPSYLAGIRSQVMSDIAEVALLDLAGALQENAIDRAWWLDDAVLSFGREEMAMISLALTTLAVERFHSCDAFLSRAHALSLWVDGESRASAAFDRANEAWLRTASRTC